MSKPKHAIAHFCVQEVRAFTTEFILDCRTWRIDFVLNPFVMAIPQFWDAHLVEITIEDDGTPESGPHVTSDYESKGIRMGAVSLPESFTMEHMQGLCEQLILEYLRDESYLGGPPEPESETACDE